MEIEHPDILIRLLIAHLLADFFFQGNTMAQKKKQGIFSLHFQVHILIVGIITYMLLGQWCNWLGPLIIMVAHAVVDAIKVKIESTFEHLRKYEKWIFIVDQTLHVFTLFLYWIITSELIKGFSDLKQAFNEKLFTNAEVLIIVASYLVITMPTGVFVSFLTKKWQKEIARDDRSKRQNNHEYFLSGRESLKDAGKTIGMIERSLVLTFVLMQQYQAIGFLIAAKSVFRFGDLKEAGQRKRTEYILIGTFISFIISIICGILVNYLITIF